jgi:beta-phosphoglucomutase-like phosphatase (HAD superfamily)
MSKGVDRVRTQGILFDMDGTLLGTCTPREEKTEGHRLDTGRRDDLARFLRAAWA